MLLLVAALSALATPASAPPDPSWLVGQWRGGEGAVVYEERWEPARGGAMLGTFRYVQGDAVRFYELMTIGPGADGVVTLRIKHFGPELTGWEASDAHVGFRLASGGPDELVFVGVTEPATLRYHRTGDQLSVTLDKGEQQHAFRFTRVD